MPVPAAEPDLTEYSHTAEINPTRQCYDSGMANESKKYNTRIIVWSVIWALALIVAGVVYKGNPAKDQIEAVLTVVGTFVLLALLPSRSKSCIR